MAGMPEHGFWLFKSCLMGIEFPGSESSIKFVFDKLGIKYLDDSRQSCCTGMGMMVDVFDPLTSAVIAARNFHLAAASGFPYLATICTTCLGINKKVCNWVNENPQFADKIRETLAKINLQYDSNKMKKENVFHVADVIHKWKDKVRREKVIDFQGIPIAAHYGCHYYKIHHGEKPEKLQVLEEIIEAIGGKPVNNYPEKYLCCGSGYRHRHFNQQLANSALEKKMSGVRESGAEVLVNMCPMCFFQFDRFQSTIEKRLGKTFNLVHFNVAQLVALALGADPYKVVGIQCHRTKVESLLQRILKK
jgi:heterodisulfide reductase subunit B